jgi:hypothetical protein
MSGITNYTLKYRTFDQLLSDVRVDMPNYALENMIDPATLVKVARRCNYDLGLRINSTKEILLEVEKGRVKLPDDFYTVNFGMICGSFTETTIMPQGIHTEEIPLKNVIPQYREQPQVTNLCTPPVVCSNCHLVPCGCSTTVLQNAAPSCACACNPCQCPPKNSCSTAVYNPLEPYGTWYQKPRVFLNCKGDCFELVQILNTQTRTHKIIRPLQFINNAEGIECGCPGLYMKSADQAWIKNDYLYVNFQHGSVYLNYQGLLQDTEGNLLVPDHEMLNDFYEYSVKVRILENLLMNDENVGPKLQLMEERRKVAKGQAKQIVQTPNFEEMKEMYFKNREAQHAKYYSQFASHSWFDNSGYNGYLGL